MVEPLPTVFDTPPTSFFWPVPKNYAINGIEPGISTLVFLDGDTVVHPKLVSHALNAFNSDNSHPDGFIVLTENTNSVSQWSFKNNEEKQIIDITKKKSKFARACVILRYPALRSALKNFEHLFVLEMLIAAFGRNQNFLKNGSAPEHLRWLFMKAYTDLCKNFLAEKTRS